MTAGPGHTVAGRCSYAQVPGPTCGATRSAANGLCFYRHSLVIKVPGIQTPDRPARAADDNEAGQSHYFAVGA
jgi:hypothetical protein